MLRVAGLTLVAYGFVAGLVPPPVPFFPGNLLNSQVFEAILIVPTAVPRTILGLILAITTIRALEVFDLEIERRLARMEEASLIQTEHDRIARELHDGAIQKVYTAGLLVESLRRWVPAEGDGSTRVERAVSALNDAIADLRQNLRELSPTAPRQPLAERLRLLSEDPRFASLIRLTTDLELPADSVGEPGQADHVVAIATEALSNTIRHAHASRVRLTARLTDGQLALTIEDDGIGLPKDAAFGFGLRNMRDRARLLAGELSLQNRTEGGTRVVLVVPWVPP
jgi:signal transduction histidine kinase